MILLDMVRGQEKNRIREGKGLWIGEWGAAGPHEPCTRIKRLDIRAKITNILDEDYEVGGTIVRPLARPGRGFELSLGYHF